MQYIIQRLLNVRVGTGAATLPSISSPFKDLPAVTRIHLTYAKLIQGGHSGARHFWRNCLPRLKFYNPAVQMSVKQTEEQDGPAALTIFFSGQPSKKQAYHDAALEDKYAPAPAESEEKVVLNIKEYNFEEIWQQVKDLTGATDIEATKKDKEDLENFRKLDVKAEADRIRVAGMRQAKKDQERMLQEARGEVEKLREL
jgi:large subunit ribosomal protein MRP49